MFSDICTVQVVDYSVQWQKPIPSFPSGTLAGHLLICVYVRKIFIEVPDKYISKWVGRF